MRELRIKIHIGSIHKLNLWDLFLELLLNRI